MMTPFVELITLLAILSVVILIVGFSVLLADNSRDCNLIVLVIACILLIFGYTLVLGYLGLLLACGVCACWIDVWQSKHFRSFRSEP